MGWEPFKLDIHIKASATRQGQYKAIGQYIYIYLFLGGNLHLLHKVTFMCEWRCKREEGREKSS